MSCQKVEIKDIKELMESNKKTYLNMILQFIDQRKEIINEFPKLSLLSINKDDQIYSPYELTNFYKYRRIRLTNCCEESTIWGRLLYVDINDYKIKFENKKSPSVKQLVDTFAESSEYFNIDYYYNRLLELSKSELNRYVFEKTKTLRKSEEQTAILYTELFLKKAFLAEIDVDINDFKSHVLNNNILNEFIKSNSDLDEIRRMMKVKEAKNLLKGR